MIGNIRVLVVEDDPEIVRLLERCLSDVSMEVVSAPSNRGAMDAVESRAFDVAIVDLGLPDGDGLGLARELSSRDDLGVIILTGRGDVTDKVVGLELGADDYVTKPFERRELIARVKSLARRMQGRTGTVSKAEADSGSDNEVQFNGWTLDRGQMKISNTDGRTHDLSASEYSLLSVFVDHPGRILTRNQIMDSIFGNATPAFDRSIDIRVSRLRAKLEDNARHPTLIVTARNMGYVFRGKIESD